ncbi:hypothetical protein IB286_13825 [Spongiibacter sp. KMU-158]|uniref:Uncharacterized protein n=1 Tax=Spongiibacter pelagi TaxID=2760804 RepID=A0A927C3F3_9GAMM|nr:hypothetical protein [Spongiibacter pelagi]MBD2860079.1 hypothetical protein [Spongiibacter pelagi]
MEGLVKSVLFVLHIICIYFLALLGGEVLLGLMGVCFAPGYGKSHLVTSAAVTLFYLVTMQIFWPDKLYYE